MVTVDTVRDRTGSPPAPGSARDRAYEWIRDSIIIGSLEGGRFLDEHWVCEQVGLSRTPVREAFSRLAAERFIVLLPRRGAQVRTVTPRELEEVYQARRLLEGAAITTLCESRHGVPPEMETYADLMESADAQGDWVALTGYDRSFHRSMVEAAGNGVVTDLYDTLRSRQQRVAVQALKARPGRVGTINAEHRRLIAALRTHDTDDARACLDQHLRPVPEIVDSLRPGPGTG